MNEARLQFWLSIITWWLLSQAALFSAAQWLGPRLPARWTVVGLVLLALAFVAARFVEIHKGLRQAALFLFGGIAGSLMGQWMPVHWQQNGGVVVLVSMVGTVVALLVAARLQAIGRFGGRGLVIFSWCYVAGWIVFWLVPAPGFWIRVWAGLGVLLFWALIALWSSWLQASQELPDVTRAGSQLTLLSLNLIVSILFLFGA